MAKTKKPTAPKDSSVRVLVLRTSNADLTSYGGFQWPASGHVSCPDWDPEAKCGGGLHGLLWADGDASLLSSNSRAVWQVVSVDPQKIVAIDAQKVKFPEGEVVYSGKMAGALTMVLTKRWGIDERLKSASSTTGDYAHSSTAGNSAHSSTAGDSAHSSTAGNFAHSSTTGDYAHSSTAGNFAHSSTTGDYAHSSTAGNSAHSSTAGDSAHSSTTGNSAHSSTTGHHAIAAALGRNSQVSAGENGCICAAWHDGHRPRIAVGYVGENGIKALTVYEVDSKGNFVEVPND